MSGWRFALPPSMGPEPVRALARDFAAVLYEAGFSTVWPQKTYGGLEGLLLGGETDAAWGPPLVCARIEAAGGLVALRALRYGAATYRSAILCRAEDNLELESLGKTRRRPRAVWVDERSMSGHLLPRAHLKSLGIDPERVFTSERFAGSYEQCLQDVLEGHADMTGVFAAAASANRPAAGYVELCGFRALDLRVMGYTGECPNDGVVLSPRLAPAVSSALLTALRRLVADPGSRRQLAQAYGADGFDEPPRGSYLPLVSIA